MTMAAFSDPDEPGPPALTVVATPPPAALWRPRTQADLAPPGEKAKARANLAALRVLRDLEAAARPATPDESATLARWAGWGAVPKIFDDGDATWSAERAELRRLILDPAAWTAARETTINAHYTPAEVVSAMWDAVMGLGFTGGRVLEPGCGSGNFIGLAPSRYWRAGHAPVDPLPIEFVGIELDPTTAAIAAALYPDADIRAQGFEYTTFVPDHFDLVVGNVPFAKFALNDPHWNKPRHSIHNHFLIKALHFLRPGGLAVVLTSRYTLDSRNPAPRREMSELAELVGAVRLPEGAFHAAAGTKAIEDILILRRRTGVPSLFSTAWGSLATVPAAGKTGTVEVNEYFAAHPGHMLGEVATGRGMYRDEDFTLKATGELSPALTAALSAIVAEGLGADLGWVAPARPRPKAVAPRRPKPVAVPPAAAGKAAGETRGGAPTVIVPPAPRKEGTILATDGPTRFGKVTHGVIEDYAPNPRSDTKEVGMLVRLRDVLAALLDVQAASGDDEAFAAFQALLNAVYDEYVAAFGPINRFKLARTGRTDDDGEDKTRRVRPRMGGFRAADPDFPSLLALEVFDPDSQTALKAPIFTTRVVAPRSRTTSATTGEDALSLCLDEYGEVRLDVIANLLGAEVPEAIAMLGTLVWENPDTGEHEVAQRYLSGNVRRKLHRARIAAAGDPRFAANVAALEAVMPEDLGPTEIDARLGCTWITEEDVSAFATEVLGVDKGRAEIRNIAINASWRVGVPGWVRHTVAMKSTWGTGRADAASILEDSLNQRPVTVYDTLPDKRRIVNTAETLSAREKQEALEARFGEWVWEDHERATRLAAMYNERFNSTVAPAYDGSHLSLPGISTHLTPHPHQLNSIWRIISEPTVGLFHPVGAGKTLVMAAAGMESRRLGLVRKPVYVVPNHMLEQFCAEFIQHYPLARLLLATKDQTEKGGRKQFVARCAMGDWDAIIITRSAFERIPLSAQTRADFLGMKMAALERVIAAEGGTKTVSVKRLVLALKKLRERHERLLAEHRKDDGVTFEETGIDYIFADEAHGYKNMQFASHMQGVGGEGSQRAEDLEAKLLYLRDRYGNRICTLSTATPVANSLAEIFVMQRFLQPEDLAEAGIYEFDAWAATFGQTVNQLELAPDGSTYRIGTRFARFRNVPDLMRMFRAAADVRTPEELNLPVPAVAGGQAAVVVVPPTPAHQEFMLSLAARAEDIRNRLVRPDEDNMLKVSTDGRKAALDPRLVGLTPDGPVKAEVAADHIAGIYRRTRDLPFRDPTGEVAPRRGGFQLIFCDLGTPHEGRWTVYEQLRGHLVARGVPSEAVRFIHEAADDRAKAEIFAACRDGRVAVLVASTEKAGVGTNIQPRMVALHHLDCPWRPCDIEQREGRGVRQGNQNDEILLFRYVTERTFDTYLWQTVARKAAFIYQVMSGKFKGREVDDLGEQALSYAEVKALATGNPLLMEQAGVDTEIATLTRRRRAHYQDQTRLQRVVVDSEEGMDRMLAEAEQCAAAIAVRTDTNGNRFGMDVDGTWLTDRAVAGQGVINHLLRSMHLATKAGYTEPVGTLGGLTVVARWRKWGQDGYGSYYGGTSVTLGIRDVPRSDITWERGDVSGVNPLGLIRQLEHRITGLDQQRLEALASHERIRGELGAARARLGQTFPDEGELARLTHRAEEIAAELERMRIEQETAANDAKREKTPA